MGAGCRVLCVPGPPREWSVRRARHPESPLRVTWTVSAARLRRARTAFAFALILVVPATHRAQDAPVDEARARLRKARDLTNRRDYDQALVELDQALTLADADARLSGEIQLGRGEVLFAKRDWSGMRTAYETAADLFEKAGAFRDQARALRGLVYTADLSWEQKERTIEHATEVLRRDPDPVVEGLLLHSWGDVLVNLGRYGLALKKLEEAREKLEGSPDESAFARLLTSLGRAERLHGRPEAALPHYRRALGIQTRAQDYSGAAQSENAIAVAFRYQDRMREALVHSNRALELAERSGDSGRIAFNRLQLGLMYQRTGDYRRSLSLLSTVDAALNPEDESSRLDGLARSERVLGRHTDALAHAEQAVARARARAVAYHLAFALDGRALCHVSLGHSADALQRRKCADSSTRSGARLVLKRWSGSATSAGFLERKRSS